MELKEAFFCASVFLVQSIAAQCLGNAYNPGFPGPLAAELAIGGPGAPNMPAPGMSLYSDNLLIEGPVIVTGRMPFLGTVAIEGAFPTAGAGAVTYGCGEGGVGIVAEIPIAPIGAPFEYGVIDGFAYNGLGSNACGSRAFY